MIKIKKVFSAVMLMVFMLNILPSVHAFAEVYEGVYGFVHSQYFSHATTTDTAVVHFNG